MLCGMAELYSTPRIFRRRYTRSMHRVYASFQNRKGWHVSFLEEDLKTSLRKHLTFADPKKIIELAERGGAKMTSEDRAMIAHGIENGRGGIWLQLTDEQYRKLS
jgi:hypothetical protein